MTDPYREIVRLNANMELEIKKKSFMCRWFGCKPSIHVGGELIKLDVLEAPNPKAIYDDSYKEEKYDFKFHPGIEFMCERCGYIEFFSMMKLNRLYKFVDLDSHYQLDFYDGNKFLYDHKNKRCSVVKFSPKRRETENKFTFYFGTEKKQETVILTVKSVTWDGYKSKLKPEPRWFQKEKIFACVKIDEVTQEKTFIDLQTFKTIKSVRQ